MKKKWLLATIISLAVIVLALFGWNKWNEYKRTEIIENVEAKVYQTVDINNLIRFELYDGNNLSFKKEGELWIDETENQIEYDQEMIKDMVTTLSQLTSFEQISNIQDKLIYGINENSKMITVYDKANASETIRIGNKVPGQDASYIWSDTDEKIYLIAHSQLEDLFFNREDIVIKDMGILPINEIEQLAIIENNKKVKFIRNPKRGTKEYDTWLLEEAFKTLHEANSELVENYIEAIETFKRDKFVTTQTQDLEAYGLGSPSLMVEINGKYTIKFGKSEGDYIYFKYSESPYIYKMLSERVEPLKEIDAFSLVRKEIYMPQKETLKSITLQQGDSLMEWIMGAEAVEDISKEEKDKKEDTLESASYIGDISLTEEQTDTLINLLGQISLYKPLVNPEVEEKQERTAEVVITYHLKDGSSYPIELIPYDPSFYILRYKGNVEFSVDKKPVVNFFNELNYIIKERQKEISSH